MDTAILNRKSSMVSHWSDKKLLWACSLISRKVYFIVEDMILDDIDFIHRLGLKEKLLFFEKIAPLIAPPHTADQLKKKILEFIKWNSIDHKNKDIVLALMTSKHYFNKFEDIYLRIMHQALGDSGIKNLYEINKTSQEKFITFTSNLSKIDRLTDTENSAKLWVETLFLMCPFAVFDSTVRNTSTFKNEISHYGPGPRLKIWPRPVLKIPSPESLDCRQFENARKGLNDKLEFLWASLSFIIRNDTAIAPEGIPVRLNDMICEAQRRVDSQAEIIFLRDSIKDITEYKIYAGVCPMKMIVKMYRDLNIIGDETVHYFESNFLDSFNSGEYRSFFILDRVEVE